MGSSRGSGMGVGRKKPEIGRGWSLGCRLSRFMNEIFLAVSVSCFSGLGGM